MPHPNCPQASCCSLKDFCYALLAKGKLPVPSRVASPHGAVGVLWLIEVPFMNPLLVGGVEHFYFPQIGNSHSN